MGMGGPSAGGPLGSWGLAVGKDPLSGEVFFPFPFIQAAAALPSNPGCLLDDPVWLMWALWYYKGLLPPCLGSYLGVTYRDRGRD